MVTFSSFHDIHWFNHVKARIFAGLKVSGNPQGGAPESYKWVIIPLTIDISPTKTIVIGLICTNLAIPNWGTTLLKACGFPFHPDPSGPRRLGTARGAASIADLGLCGMAAWRSNLVWAFHQWKNMGRLEVNLFNLLIYDDDWFINSLKLISSNIIYNIYVYIMSFDIEAMSFFSRQRWWLLNHWDFTDQDGDSRQTLKFRDLRMKYSWELTTRNTLWLFNIAMDKWPIYRWFTWVYLLKWWFSMAGNSFDHQTWQCWGFGG